MNLAKNSPKHFSKEIKELYKKKKNVSDNLSAKEFLNYFKDLYGNIDTHDDVTLLNENEYDLRTDDSLDKEITLQEIEKVIKGLKNNKACGVENVIGEIFVNCFDFIHPFIVKLFNVLFCNGIYPESWFRAYFHPYIKR